VKTGRTGAPGRREIGHGALAERSVEPMIPPRWIFPLHHPRHVRNHGIERLDLDGERLRCDALPHGCGRAHDSAVAVSPIGLITDAKTGKSVMLTDILGSEDHFGDMDFKVAGTSKGITRFPDDLKLHGLSF